jgi:outer membrane protein TolC
MLLPGLVCNALPVKPVFAVRTATRSFDILMMAKRAGYILCTIMICHSNLVFAQNTNPEKSIWQNFTIWSALEAGIVNNIRLQTSSIESDIAAERVSAEEGRFEVAVTGSALGSSIESPTEALVPGAVIGLENESFGLSVGVQKKTPSGPTVELYSQSQGYRDKVDAQTLTAYNSATIGVRVTIPIWRGRGEYLTTLPLKLAQLEFEAKQLELQFAIESLVVQIASSYWNLRGLVLRQGKLRESLKRTQNINEKIRRLIDADQLPVSEQALSEAQLKQRESIVIRGEQAITEAIGDLAVLIGASAPGFNQKIVISSDLVQPSDLATDLASLDIDRMTEKASSVRPDLQAAKIRIEAGESSVELAEDSLLPELNIVLGTSTKSYEPNFELIANPSRDRFGPDWQARLDFSWIPGQSTAKANLRVTELLLSRQKLQYVDQLRRLNADLQSGVQGLERSYTAFETANSRVSLAKISLDNETEKVVMGVSTVLDLQRIESELLSAEVDLINEHVNYSLKLNELMFYVGYLGSRNPGGLSFARLQSSEVFLRALKDDH